MRLPNSEDLIQQFLLTAKQDLEKAGMHMSGTMIQRMNYALHFTLDSMAICEHPMELRGVELLKVWGELLDAFKKGATTPNAETELKWNERERAVTQGRRIPSQITRGN